MSQLLRHFCKWQKHVPTPVKTPRPASARLPEFISLLRMVEARSYTREKIRNGIRAAAKSFLWIVEARSYTRENTSSSAWENAKSFLRIAEVRSYTRKTLWRPLCCMPAAGGNFLALKTHSTWFLARRRRKIFSFKNTQNTIFGPPQAEIFWDLDQIRIPPHIRIPPLIIPRFLIRGGGILKWNSPDEWLLSIPHVYAASSCLATDGARENHPEPLNPELPGSFRRGLHVALVPVVC